MKRKKLSAVIVATLLIGIAHEAMADRQDIAGQFRATPVAKEVMPVFNQEGHILVMTESKGLNKEGNSGYMDGATVLSREIQDLALGNGPQRGYTVMSKDGEETLTRFEGRVTTTLDEKGNPETTCKGTWEKVSGTGQYEGVRGSGTYTCQVVPGTEDVVVDWRGTLNR